MDVIAVKEQGSLDGTIGRASEVVAVTTSNVAMKGGLASCIASSEDLKDVKFTASTLPAGAVRVTVLQSTWDLGVEHPDGWHVHWVIDALTGLAIVGHAEFEEERLAWAVPAVVSDSAVANVAT